MSNMTTREFRTRRLHFASWIHTSAQLEFLGAEFNPRANKVDFLFGDPRNIGHGLEAAVDEGPGLIFSSMHFMRRQMSAVQNAANAAQNQNPNGDHRSPIPPNGTMHSFQPAWAMPVC